MLQQELSSELQKIGEAIEWAQSNLEHAPAGRLLVSASGKTPRYYHRKNSQDKTGKYLGKRDKELIAALAQKDYETKLLKVAEQRKEQLIKAQKFIGSVGAGVDDDALALVYTNLPDARKEYVAPYVVDDDEYARQWQDRDYAGNNHPYGVSSLYTRRGEQVRSKSEVIIADALYSAGVPYQYERPVYIGGYNSVYPDFTVLKKRTRTEYFWEHYGGIDDANYRERMVQRINKYALAGYVLGDKLIATYETTETPLDTRVVNELIQRVLL